jgi:hypothetical protein
VGDQQAVIVGDRDQVSVEEPMRGGGKRDSVLDDIGSASLDRPDMGSLHFCPAATIDDTQLGYRASIAVRIAYMTPEVCVSYFAIHQDLNDFSLLLFSRRDDQ